MSTSESPFPLLPDQIEILQQQGLIINNADETNHYLTHVGFYRLAGYWQFLQKNRMFVPGTKFRHVVDLYNFDRELRLLLLDAFERIEISFRAILINQMCAAYGPYWYADASLFFSEEKMNDVLETINRELDRSEEGFIKQHNRDHDKVSYPPAWKTLQVLSFGTLSKIYGNIRNDIQEKRMIANVYGLPKSEWLQSWMQVISVLRNYCAHHSRICYQLFANLPKVIRHTKLPWIKHIPAAGRIGFAQLYFHLSIVRYLLHTASPGNTFSYRMMELLVKYPGIELERMGFPKNWDDEDLWQ
jgi:abortive infection bacteriophage resistance protein